MPTTTCIHCVALACVLNVLTGTAHAQVIIQKDDSGIWFLENKKKILQYRHKATSLDGKFRRAAYVHPLYDLDQHVITEDFPVDHPHQRGIFWAWHQVFMGQQRAGDAWLASEFEWDVLETNPEITDGVARLNTRVHWKSPAIRTNGEKIRPLVEENTSITVYPANNEARTIDFVIRLRALQPDVSIGGSEDDKGYGGFSARIHLPENVRFVGRNGTVEPKRNAVAAGPWIDVQGSFGSGTVSGVAIFCHSANVGYPQKWILRSRDSMQNPVYPGRERVGLSRDQPLVLAYRLVLHRQLVDNSTIDQWFEQYVNEQIK